MSQLTLNSILARLLNLQVGGFTSYAKVSGSTLGATSATYATGRTLGTGNPIALELTRSQTGSGVLQTVCLQDLSAQSGAVDIIFFDSNPSATTFTNNVALDIADADIAKIIGFVSITSSDYSAFADNVVGQKNNIGLVLKSATAPYNKIYVAFVSRDAKTYVANEVSATFGVLQD